MKFAATRRWCAPSLSNAEFGLGIGHPKPDQYEADQPSDAERRKGEGLAQLIRYRPIAERGAEPASEPKYPVDEHATQIAVPGLRNVAEVLFAST
jgi:hypothetical protein